MKAKEFAANIIAERACENIKAVVVDSVIAVVNETLALAASRHAEASKYAALNEGFKKWRSVVTQVKATAPELYIEEGMFLQAIYLDNPVGFAQCVRNNVFLGHELSESEQAALKEASKALRAAESAERQRREDAEDARFEKLMGLPKGYIKERKESEKAISESLQAFAAAVILRHAFQNGDVAA